MTFQKGRAKTGGRRKSVPNMVTAEEKRSIEELARQYATDAMMALHRVATTSRSDRAVVAASEAILNRAYGCARPADTNEGGMLTLEMIVRASMSAEAPPERTPIIIDHGAG
jgi:hypothetical protein